MSRKKISTQLLKGYFLIAFLILTLAGTVYTTYQIYTNSKLEQSNIDMVKFIDEYKIDREQAIKNQNFEEDDFIIITNFSNNIVDSYNIDNPTNDDLYTLIEESEVNNYTYYLFEDMENNLYFHLYLSPYNENTNIILILLMFAIITFIIFALFYAHMTSKKIIQPLEKLRIGVKAISNGHYNHIIEFETNNELDDIKCEINQMREQLSREINNRERLEKERNDLILSLSHDIKTPLTNIIGYSETLTKMNLPDDIRTSIETIYKYGLSAAELTNELFDYTKINNFDFIETELKDIVEITRLKIIDYINEFEKLNINYTLNLPDAPIWSHINVLMYNRVIDNILQNAIKYNYSNFSIDISIKSNGTNALISIKDNGCGIPLKYHSTIFDPMTRVENSRNRKLGGTGLGLSIAKNIITKHGGSINLDSQYRKGCRFIIKLPLIKTEVHN